MTELVFELLLNFTDPFVVEATPKFVTPENVLFHATDSLPVLCTTALSRAFADNVDVRSVIAEIG